MTSWMMVIGGGPAASLRVRRAGLQLPVQLGPLEPGEEPHRERGRGPAGGGAVRELPPAGVGSELERDQGPGGRQGALGMPQAPNGSTHPKFLSYRSITFRYVDIWGVKSTLAVIGTGGP
eukprot:1182703-Prorocentrum_minimum.AAC.1